ncbi:hypothetical protein ACFYXH_41305 [Streptomyces sp. NPDC002730]|uniref:hypothetical protein n=1 Tax=Streptomyces sp. NPDC002730 TaxID=3364662 RepID=UPI00368A7AC8
MGTYGRPRIRWGEDDWFLGAPHAREANHCGVRLVTIAAIAVMVSYPLTERKFREIVAAIAQRHAEPGPDTPRA